MVAPLAIKRKAQCGNDSFLRPVEHNSESLPRLLPYQFLPPLTNGFNWKVA